MSDKSFVDSVERTFPEKQITIEVELGKSGMLEAKGTCNITGVSFQSRKHMYGTDNDGFEDTMSKIEDYLFRKINEVRLNKQKLNSWAGNEPDGDEVY